MLSELRAQGLYLEAHPLAVARSSQKETRDKSFCGGHGIFFPSPPNGNEDT